MRADALLAKRACRRAGFILLGKKACSELTILPTTGLPIGIQLVARRAADHLLLAIAASLERR